MLIEVECSKCAVDFGVTDSHVRVFGDQVMVSKPFCCPYCKRDFERTDVLKFKGTRGGVNITGPATIKGDVAGRDLIK